MPSIDAVEQFKSVVRDLANEPAIREAMGLPPEEILPPESQLDDLADLLGAMPSGPDDTGGAEVGAEPSVESDGLEDLFDVPLPPHEEPVGPSLEDLLGPPAPLEDLDLAGEGDLGGDPDLVGDADLEFAELMPEGDQAESTPSFDLGSLDDLGTPGTEAEVGDFDAPMEPGTDFDLGAADLFGAESESVTPAPAAPSRAQAGVSPEDLDDAFFETPGDNLFGAPAEASDDLEFEPMGGDFPELAGYADTKEEDVETFDALQEADEFQLGDFESQFGITADDHTDAEFLTPAPVTDLEAPAPDRSLSLSEAEFQTLQRTLGQLPLNLRLAIEELLGEKDVGVDDFEKVVDLLLVRAPVRSIANNVGRILGRKITIPPGFEKGSGAEVEARQATLWYNLKTIMFPVFRVSLLVTAAVAVLVLLGWNFLVKPFKANDLYDRGLVAARQNDGVTADELFAQAWYYWPAQDRFFQYAETYQDTGDYDRARRKYLELLKPSVRPYLDGDEALLEQRFGRPLAPLPEGLEGQALVERLAAKKDALDAYYAYVITLLSSKDAGADVVGEVPGEVILGNPDPKGILDYSRFETEFGFDGRDREAHYRRADAILRPLLASRPGDKAGLLRKADNQLEWSRDLSSRENLDLANSALSEYLRLYGWDSPVTWRFVRVFLLQDEETELLRLRDQIDGDRRLAIDGETMAHLARWLIDREESTVEKERAWVPAQKTIEEEYGIRPQVVEAPEAPAPEAGDHGAASASGSAAHSLARAAAGGGDHGGGGEAGAEAPPAVRLEPPYKYPYSTQPFRPRYLERVDTLLLRAMDTQKSLPELHYQLSRFYRHNKNQEDERRALAAADAYFQRLEPRKARLNDRPAMRVATSNRIGEVFEARGEPLQAERYYLDAQKNFESYRAQGLATFDNEATRLYRNLGNLYYRQTPGVEALGTGTVPGAWLQALKLYQTADQGPGRDPQVVYRQGVIAYESRDFSEAVKRFFVLDTPGNRGESSGRQNPNLLYAMGNALFRSGNFASAEGYYRELLVILRDQRSRIQNFDPVVRGAHRELAQRLYETWNNLGAAQYRAANTFRSGTPEFKQAIVALTSARAQAQVLGQELYANRSELDITQVDEAKLQGIRDDEARILALTRKEKGLIEANLQVLSLLESASPSRKEALAQQLEIFARIPLELDQDSAP